MDRACPAEIDFSRMFLARDVAAEIIFRLSEANNRSNNTLIIIIIIIINDYSCNGIASSVYKING
jgi:hypothetical protein